MGNIECTGVKPFIASILSDVERQRKIAVANDGSYQNFLERGLLLTSKLLNQGFLFVKLKSSLRLFYGSHHDLVDRYGISVKYG
jgi:hypothetical protein